jgi:hypothetical protein
MVVRAKYLYKYSLKISSFIPILTSLNLQNNVSLRVGGRATEWHIIMEGIERVSFSRGVYVCSSGSQGYLSLIFLALCRQGDMNNPGAWSYGRSCTKGRLSQIIG